MVTSLSSSNCATWQLLPSSCVSHLQAAVHSPGLLVPCGLRCCEEARERMTAPASQQPEGADPAQLGITQAAFHRIDEIVNPRSAIENYRIYPWGFANLAREKKYVDYFWLTAAQN
eukprot:1825675-Rhodomonas_salina.1